MQANLKRGRVKVLEVGKGQKKTENRPKNDETGESMRKIGNGRKIKG